MSRPVFLFIQDRTLIRFLLSNPQPPMPDTDLGRYCWCRAAIKVVCRGDMLPSFWPIIPGAEVR